MLLVPLMVVWIPGAQAQGSTITEGFEDEAILADPEPSASEYDFVKSTSGGKAVIAENAARTGSQSYFLDNFDGSFAFDALDVNATAFDIYVNVSTSISTSRSMKIELHDCGGIAATCGAIPDSSSLLRVQLNYDGTGQCFTADSIRYVKHSGASGSGSTTACVGGPNEWLLVRAFLEGGDSGTFKVQLPDYLEQSEISTNVSRIGDLRTFQIIPASAQDWSIDDITISGAGDVPGVQSFGAASTVAVNNLVGFDIDRSGTTAIARTDGGTFIRTYGGNSLNAAGSTPTANCNQKDGVSSIGTHVSYTDCDDAGNVDTLSIRSGTLGDPARPSGCVDECLENFKDTDIPDKLGELRDTKAFAYNYGSRQEIGTFIDNSNVATVWFFSTEDGHVGAYGHVAVNNLPDEDDTDLVLLDPASSPQIDSICGGRGAGNEDILYGVTPNGATGAFRLDVSFTKSSGARIAPNVNLAELFRNTAGFGKGTAVACSFNGLFAVQHEVSGGAFEVHVIDVASGNVVNGPITVTSPKIRGLAMDTPGEHLAYVDGTEAFIYDLEEDRVVANMTLPAGNFKSIHMDAQAQSIWIATDSSINRYEVFEATTGDPVSIVSDPPVSLPTDPPEPGSPAEAQAQIATAFDISSTAGGLILAAAMALVIIGAVVGLLVEDGKAPSAMIISTGAVIGIIVTFGMGWISTEIMVMIVAIGLLLGFVMVKS